MKNTVKFKTICGCITAITLLTGATIIVARGAANTKSTYEQKIEAIMVDYVRAIQLAENTHDTKMAPVIKAARTVRDDAIAKAARLVLARFERAAKDAKRLERTADAELAKEKITEFKELIERAKSADPDRTEVEEKVEKVVEKPPLASHVTFGGHAYLAIMGKHTIAEALAICKRTGGNLVCIESAKEMLFLQKELPVGHTLWVGASDPSHRGKWRWVNGKVVNMGCWASGHPRPPKYRLHNGTWSNIHAALGSRGVVSLAQDAKCRGFICEWGR